MRPAITSAEEIVISRASVDELTPGDVVAVLSARGEPIAHRVIAIEGSARGVLLRTRGDGLPYEDPPSSPDQLLGRVARGGRLGRAIARYPRLALLLGAATTVRRPSDVPHAAAGLIAALYVQVARLPRRFGARPGA